MMLRFRVSLVVVSFFVILLTTLWTPARANWFRAICAAVQRDSERNTAWPRPFVYPDRHAARAPFYLMVNKGWHHQNLLGSHHFDASTHQLNESGRVKVQWILTQNPISRRTLFVQRGLTRHVTDTRVASVRRNASTMLPEGDKILVVESNLVPLGVPAEYIDAIYRKSTATIPNPRIPPPNPLKP